MTSGTEPSTDQATEPGQRRRTPLTGMLSAYLVSVMCTAVSAIAIPWFVLSTTGSATRTGMVVFAEMAPYVTMQAVAGPWVERFGPRRASWIANTVSGIALLLVPVLYATDNLGHVTLFAVVAVVGALRGIADCGSAPLVPGTAKLALTPLERAAGLHSSATQAGSLLGAPLAAVLLTWISAPLVLTLSAGGFLLAAALVRLLVPAEVGPPEPAGETPEPYLRRLQAGITFLAREPVLRAVVLMVAATNLLSGGYISVLLTSWVRTHDLPVASVGTVAAAFGLGALGGSLIGAWIAPRVNRWLMYSVGFLLGAAPFTLGLAFTETLTPMIIVAVCCGLAGGGLNPIIGAVQYERIPPARLPRVLGAVKASAWIGLPVGPVIAGLLVDVSGLTVALLVIAGAALALTLLPFVLPVFRGLNERPASSSSTDD